MATILVVDDSPTEIFKFKEILQNSGFDVIEASSGADGVALAKQALPDLILMDVVMPGLNGFQATRQLSKAPETEHIPVVILTTKDQPTDKVWGQRQGAKEYLVKPVDEDVLIQAIQRFLP